MTKFRYYDSKAPSLAASLINRTILKVSLEKIRERIVFETDQGDVAWETTADCCSRSWIEHQDVPLGRVSSVEDLGRVKTEDPDDSICIKFYGIKIRTDKGSGTVDFRNSSNGYYGGDMAVVEVPGLELCTICEKPCKPTSADDGCRDDVCDECAGRDEEQPE